MTLPNAFSKISLASALLLCSSWASMACAKNNHPSAAATHASAVTGRISHDPAAVALRPAQPVAATTPGTSSARQVSPPADPNAPLLPSVADAGHEVVPAHGRARLAKAASSHRGTASKPAAHTAPHTVAAGPKAAHGKHGGSVKKSQRHAAVANKQAHGKHMGAKGGNMAASHASFAKARAHAGAAHAGSTTAPHANQADAALSGHHHAKKPSAKGDVTRAPSPHAAVTVAKKPVPKARHLKVA